MKWHVWMGTFHQYKFGGYSLLKSCTMEFLRLEEQKICRWIRTATISKMKLFVIVLHSSQLRLFIVTISSILDVAVTLDL